MNRLGKFDYGLAPQVVVPIAALAVSSRDDAICLTHCQCAHFSTSFLYNSQQKGLS